MPRPKSVGSNILCEKLVTNKFVWVRHFPAWNALGTDLKVTESKLFLGCWAGAGECHKLLPLSPRR